jgi:hypothetical protein
VNCSGPPSVGLDALLRARFHGAVNIRGIRYQLLYSALLTLRLHDEGGEQISLRFEGVEDADLLGLEAGGEYVQVKTAVTRWNWALRRGAGVRRGGFRGSSPGARGPGVRRKMAEVGAKRSTLLGLRRSGSERLSPAASVSREAGGRML